MIRLHGRMFFLSPCGGGSIWKALDEWNCSWRPRGMIGFFSPGGTTRMVLDDWSGCLSPRRMNVGLCAGGRDLIQDC